MAKRGPKPKAKKAAKKRDYSAERRKTVAKKTQAATPKWLIAYIAQINDGLASMYWEERDLEVEIPAERPEFSKQWTDLETVTRIEAYAEEPFRLELADNDIAVFSPNHTGNTRAYQSREAVTTMYRVTPPEPLHQNWKEKVRPDILTLLNISSLLKWDTFRALFGSNAYFNLVAEASQRGKSKRRDPAMGIIPLPSNKKAAAKLAKLSIEDLLRRQDQPYLDDNDEEKPRIPD